MQLKSFMLLIFVLCTQEACGQNVMLCRKLDKRVDFKDVKYIPNSSFDISKSEYALSRCDLKKINNKISFIAKNGKKIVFLDKKENQDDTEQQVYECVGVIQRINSYVVREIEYEWVNYILINCDSGNSVRLWGMPCVSPDGKKVLSYAANLIYDPMPNGIQVFAVTKGSYTCILEYKSEDWEPKSVAWKDNESIYVKKFVPAVVSSNRRNITKYGILKL